jgi:hypothetical protein
MELQMHTHNCHRPTYEIYHGIGGYYWVVRIVDNKATLVDRYEDRETAEDMIALMTHIHTAPRRLASH